jgi:hypothetical protein
MYVYDKNTFSSHHRRERREKRELKNEATPTMLLKTHVEKMSVWATPTIFMKTSDLSRDSHDIHENKGSCASGPTAPKALEGSTLGPGVNQAAAHFPAKHEKKMLKKDVRSRNVYENKGLQDTMPEYNQTLGRNFRHLRRIERHFAENCPFETIICQINAVCRDFTRALCK